MKIPSDFTLQQHLWFHSFDSEGRVIFQSQSRVNKACFIEESERHTRAPCTPCTPCTPFGVTTSERGLDCWARKQNERNLCLSLMNFTKQRSHDPLFWQRRRGRLDAEKLPTTCCWVIFTCCFWGWRMSFSTLAHTHHRLSTLNWMDKKKRKKLARKAAFQAG